MAKPQFDPTHLPIDSIAGEAPVPAERLNAAWLRERFAAPPLWTPEPSDETWAPRADPTPASVLVPLVQRPRGLSLLLTMRTAHLNDHAGQIAFPGGRAEHFDADAVDTALRETEEEIGLARDFVEPVARLPHYMALSGFRITPVLGIVRPGYTLTLNPTEVAAAFEVPLSFLMNPDNHGVGSGVWQGSERHYYTIPYEGRRIWGITAGIVRMLYERLYA